MLLVLHLRPYPLLPVGHTQPDRRRLSSKRTIETAAIGLPVDARPLAPTREAHIQPKPRQGVFCYRVAVVSNMRKNAIVLN
jgi:hypothetical protein